MADIRPQIPVIISAIFTRAVLAMFFSLTIFKKTKQNKTKQLHRTSCCPFSEQLSVRVARLKGFRQTKEAGCEEIALGFRPIRNGINIQTNN